MKKNVKVVKDKEKLDNLESELVRLSKERGKISKSINANYELSVETSQILISMNEQLRHLLCIDLEPFDKALDLIKTVLSLLIPGSIAISVVDSSLLGGQKHEILTLLMIIAGGTAGLAAGLLIVRSRISAAYHKTMFSTVDLLISQIQAAKLRIEDKEVLANIQEIENEIKDLKK